MNFVCPKCKGELLLQPGGTKRCSLGHSFDKAKDGYYNLLLGSDGGVHGDNDAMLRARRDFLSRGYYEPLAKEVADTVLQFTPRGGCVLDAGCGEGYYTDLVERTLRARDRDSCVLAFDISKAAAKLTAKHNRNLSVAVASAYRMPVTDGSVDTLLNVFSPDAKDESVRVLKPGGILVLVYPDTDHLFELKSILYDTPYKNEPKDEVPLGFSHEQTRVLDYMMTLDNADDISSLFAMTPYAYRTNEAGRVRLYALDRLVCRAQFRISVYRKL